MRLTRSFSLEQLIYSETAERERIDNTPGPDIIKNLPIGEASEWKPEHCIPCREIKERVERIAPLLPLTEAGNGHGGPARLFKFPGAAGEIGFISPVSEHFCVWKSCPVCDRLC